MRIPHIINSNIIKTYDVPNIFLRKEKIVSNNFTWDSELIKTLREKSLNVITRSENWKINPLYAEVEVPADKLFLLELLPTDLPLELTVPIIDADYYWERCYKALWPNASLPNLRVRYDKSVNNNLKRSENSKISNEIYQSIDSEKEMREYSYPSVESIEADTNMEENKMSDSTLTYVPKPTTSIIVAKTWKQCVLEKILAEEIEKMQPDVFNSEYIKDLTNLHGSYIVSLNIKQLKPCAKEDRYDHVSLYTLIINLPNLIDLSICFNKANLLDNFTWQSRKISESDCELLGNAIAGSQIKILRISRSDIDCNKVKLMTRPLCNYTNLVILELSHCKIGDKGAGAICGMLMKNQVIEQLILTNNKIGPEGAKSIGFYLCHEDSQINTLILKLNPLQVEGGKYIGTGLVRGAKTLRSLDISACGLTKENLHFGLALSMNTTLLKLDISNNKLGEESGPNFILAMESNNTIIHFDVRMCGLPKNVVNAIELKVRKNLESFRGTMKTPPSAENVL